MRARAHTQTHSFEEDRNMFYTENCGAIEVKSRQDMIITILALLWALLLLSLQSNP